MVYIDNRLRSALFGQADLELVVAFADQAAIAIDNARLYQGAQARLQEITDLVGIRPAFSAAWETVLSRLIRPADSRR